MFVMSRSAAARIPDLIAIASAKRGDATLAMDRELSRGGVSVDSVMIQAIPAFFDVESQDASVKQVAPVLLRSACLPWGAGRARSLMGWRCACAWIHSRAAISPRNMTSLAVWLFPSNISRFLAVQMAQHIQGSIVDEIPDGGRQVAFLNFIITALKSSVVAIGIALASGV